MGDDSGGHPRTPGPEPPEGERPEDERPDDQRPDDQRSEERWQTVQPKANWREPTRPGGFLARHPMVGVVIMIILLAVGALAFVGALRARTRTSSAGGAVSGVLRVAVLDVPSLDPADARDPESVMVVDQLFDTLVRNTGELEPAPGLAGSVSADATQTAFTFRLAPGARFDDGAPVTAADVKFTLERITRKGSTSPLAIQLEAVSGYAAWHTAGTSTGLAGVEAPDPATVVVRLDTPFSSFPSVLGHPAFGIVPKVAAESLGDQFRQAPVGSGPFRRIDSTSPGRLSLRRVVAHRSGAARVGSKGIDGIDFIDFDDAEAAYAALDEGTVDVSPVPPARDAEAVRHAGGRQTDPYIGVVFYGLNVKSPDLADPRLREAISLAVNRQEIIDDVYRGAAVVATGVVADGVPRRDGNACGERCRHDPDRARALLVEAFPTGNIPEVAVDHDDDPTQVALAQAIKTDLDTVGIPAVLRPHAFAEYGQFLVSGRAELFRLGWISDYPSPDGFLTPLFSSTSPDNLTGLAHPEIDQKLAAARAQADPARRLALYLEVEQLVLDQYVVVPVAQLESRMAASSRVRGFDLDGLGTFDGAVVSLSSKK